MQFSSIINSIKRIQTTINFHRSYCYKPIRRPNYNFKNSELISTRKTPTVDVEQKFDLAQQLKSQILATGPITVAQYMKSVLTHPTVGYYMQKDVFGQHGDFITSPEIGQIFGELIAVWLYVEWQKIGSPKPLQLIELGPGRGTLMQDILRAITKFGIKSNELSVHLVEMSPFLCDAQSRKLCYSSAAVEENDKSNCYHKGETISGIPVEWYHKIEDVPHGFSIILAHEFFDALPIHKFQHINDDSGGKKKWREILIDIDRTTNKFNFVVSRTETIALNMFIKDLNACNRDHIEYSLESDQIIEHISYRLEEHGGFALIMDYGHIGDKTDTFRAFKNHQLHDPLCDPGTADLTADVDFQHIMKIAETDNRLITFGPVQQGDFIARLNGAERLDILLQAAGSDENVAKLKSGYNMLTQADKMGERFNFLSMFPSVLQKHLKRFPVTGFQ